ncbi:MAG: hypothetical protein ACF8MJ_09125 [Phycisphaerales bacterium JB050]
MLNRTPPRDVIRELRREVGFRCPVPGCGDPFLEWHHFDPPWSEKQHHDPRGMIALCSKHHKAGDRGIFSGAQLRTFKATTPQSLTVEEPFPWCLGDFVVRFGSNYSIGCSSVIAVGGEKLLRVEQADNGILQLSFLVRTTTGEVAIEMDRNTLIADTDQLEDLQLNVGQDRISAWLAKRDYGVDLSFKRMSRESFAKLVHRDLNSDHFGSKREEIYRSMIDAGVPIDVEDLHSGEGESERFLIEAAVRRCTDSEGRICVLDFQRLSLRNNDRHVVITPTRIKGIGIRGCVTLDCGGAFSL